MYFHLNSDNEWMFSLELIKEGCENRWIFRGYMSGNPSFKLLIILLQYVIFHSPTIRYFSFSYHMIFFILLHFGSSEPVLIFKFMVSSLARKVLLLTEDGISFLLRFYSTVLSLCNKAGLKKWSRTLPFYSLLNLSISSQFMNIMS